MVMDFKPVKEEESAAHSGNRDEQPDMDSQAEERGDWFRCAVADQRGLYCPFECANASGRTGDEIREISHRDCLPATSATIGKADKMSRRYEDHSFAGPNDS